jgi:hypothetical protein
MCVRTMIGHHTLNQNDQKRPQKLATILEVTTTLENSLEVSYKAVNNHVIP